MSIIEKLREAVTPICWRCWISMDFLKNLNGDSFEFCAIRKVLKKKEANFDKLALVLYCCNKFKKAYYFSNSMSSYSSLKNSEKDNLIAFKTRTNTRNVKLYFPVSIFPY